MLNQQMVMNDIYDDSNNISVCIYYDSVLFPDLLASADKSKLEEQFPDIDDITGIAEAFDGFENQKLYATGSSRPYHINAIYYPIN